MGKRIAAFTGIFLCLTLVQAQAGQQAGLDWLHAQLSADGHFENQTGLATDYQAASAALQALHNAGDDANAAAIVSYLDSESYPSTASLARRIVARHLLNQDISSLTPVLVAYQNLDGGFGEAAGYDSTNLDSAQALQALAAAGQTDSATSALVAYLVNRQNSDGSWSGVDGAESVYITALATRTLWQLRHKFNLADRLDLASQYLLDQRTPSGLWPETYESALALVAVAPLDTGAVADSAQALAAEQQADGSWEDDVFVTALALRALQAIERGNPDLGVIKGQVIDGDYGNPVAGVAVDVSGTASFRGQTDQQGNFEFDNVPPGDYTVELTSPDYPPLQVSTSLDPGVTKDFGKIRLLQAADTTTARVTGTVTDAATGQPLSGVNVSVLNTGISAITGADGQYILAGITPGDVVIEAAKSGYDSSQTAVHLDANETLLLSPILSMPANPAFSIMGTVTDEQTGDALSGATVTVSGGASAATQTDALGIYKLSGLTPGSVTVSISLTGYQDATVSFVAENGRTFSFSPGLVPDGMTPPEVQQGGVTGKVLDERSHLPLSGVTISAMTDGAPRTTTSGSDGSFTLGELPAGGVQLTFSRDGYDDKTVILPITEGVTVDVGSIDMRPTGYAQPATAVGTVVNSITGKPLAGVSISTVFNGETRASTSDSTGHFQLDVLAETRGDITFSAQGYLDADFPAYLQEGVNDLGQIRLRMSGLDSALPDLSVTDINSVEAVTDPNTLQVTGALKVNIANKGKSGAGESDVLGFYDANGNGVYDSGVDRLLGTARATSAVAAGQSISVSLPVAGTLPFRGAPISVWVDSAEAVVESNEDNNYLTTAQACKIAPASLPPSTVQPVVKWHWTGGRVTSVPLVAPLRDTNGDNKIDSGDNPDVIFLVHHGFVDGDSATLTAVDGKTGETLWAFGDYNNRADAPSNPALADLDGDGVPEIVMYRFNGGMVAVNADGTLKWRSPYPPDPGFYDYGAINIADIDGDGHPEILARNYVLNYDGSLRFQIAGSFANSAYSIAADLDLDGVQEVILQGDAYDAAGKPFWPSRPVGNVFVAVGNFNEDRYPEVVFSSGGIVALVDHTGHLLWKVSLPGGGGGAPLVADLDGDGWPEIGVAGASYYTVFRRDGSILWHARTSDFSSRQTGSTAFDFNGDGRVEVVYGDEQRLRVYDGRTGHVVYQIPNYSTTATEEPVVADIDNDGHSEIVAVSDESSTTGVRAFQNQDDSWVGTRSIWNEHAYHINNINDDATVPAHETPSWLSHNTYRLNAFPDRNPLQVPDLSVSLLRIIDNGTGRPRSLSARIGNGGAIPVPSGVKVSFYDGDPAEGGIVLGSVELAALASGTYQDVRLQGVSDLSGQPIFAVVDPENKVSECDETNNVMSIPATRASELGDVSVATDRMQYGPGAVVHVTAPTVNTGSFAGDFRVNLRIEDQSGAQVADLGSQSLGTLAPGATAEAAADWSTGNVLSGTYRARAILSTADGTLLDQAVAVFEVQPSTGSEPLASLRTTTDRALYNVTDTANLANLARNLTTNVLIRGAVLNLEITAPDGSMAYRTSRLLGDLPASGSESADFLYSFSDASTGTYEIVATLLDSNGDTLATDSAKYDVAIQLDRAVSGQVTAQPSMAYIGDSIVCTDRLTNRTSYALQGLTIRQTLVSLAAANSVSQTEKTISLGADASQTLVRNITTDALAPGDYACALELKVDGEWQPLAHAAFHLSVPPIIIDSTFTQSGHGRLLVLLDAPTLDDRGGIDDSDPHGPPFKPGLSKQRTWLERVLDEAGWSYTIVTSADDFTREFNTHGYVLYALFSEQVKLPESVQHQVVNEIDRGAGLLVAGSHDRRNGRLEAALGIKSIGHDPHANGFDVQPFGDFVGGGETFPLSDKPLSIQTEGATALGAYRETGSANGHSGSGAPALTFFTPTQGRSMFVGFDLLQQAVANNDDVLLRQLLTAALSYSHPVNLVPYAGAVLPLTINLSNRSLATSGRVTVSLPKGAVVIDPGVGEVNAQGQPVWTFNLGVAETQTWRFWVRMPPQPGAATFTATIETGQAPDYKPYDVVQTVIRLIPKP